MSYLCSVFFKHSHLPHTNMGKMFSLMEASLSDEALVEWGHTLDWAEPAVHVIRYGAQPGGYERAQGEMYSLAEVLIMTGSERLVNVLLTTDRLPSNKLLWEDKFRNSGYNDSSTASNLINAAVRSGNDKILKKVCAMALEKNPYEASRWIQGNHGNPLSCLISQKHLDAAKVWKMFTIIQAEVKRQLAADNPGRLVKITAKNLEKAFHFTAYRQGRGDIIDLMESRGHEITQEQWEEVLEHGDVPWCLKTLSSRQSLSKSSSSDRKKEDLPLHQLLINACAGQLRAVEDTFAHSDRLKEIRKMARGHLEGLLQALRDHHGTGSLLDIPPKKMGGGFAATLVACDIKKALEFLNEQCVPLSVEEAFAWMRLSPAHAKEISHRHPLDSFLRVNLARRLEEVFQGKAGQECNLRSVAAVCVALEVRVDMDSLPITTSEQAEFEAHLLSVGSANAPSKSRGLRL